MARMSGKKAKAALKLCIKRDGPLCVLCEDKPARVLHHVDNHGDNNPNDGSNWEGRCQSCNIKSHPRGPSKRGLRMRHTMNLLRRERTGENREEIENTQVRVGTIEMERNLMCEPKFRKWLKDIIEEVGIISEKDAINGGAEYAGCSPQTIKRYLDKMCSFTGGYEFFSNDEGKRYVRPRSSKPPAQGKPSSPVVDA